MKEKSRNSANCSKI